MSRLYHFEILICLLVLEHSLSSSRLWAEIASEGDVVFESSSWEHKGLRIASSLFDVELADFQSSPQDGNDNYVGPVRDMHDGPIEASTERIIDRVTDPIAWLMNFRFRESWNWPVGETTEDTEEFQFRPTIPFKAWGCVNILRITVPYTVSSPDNGLGNVQILDLVVQQEDWGRWGIGPVVQLTSDGDSQNDSFQIGPAGGVVSKNKHWTVGVLSQNFLADEVAESRIQPVLAYKFNDSWAVGVGEFEYRYDWESSAWTQVPLGVQLERILDVCGEKLQLFINPQYNLERDSSNSGWTLFLGVSLLFPER